MGSPTSTRRLALAALALALLAAGCAGADRGGESGPAAAAPDAAPAGRPNILLLVADDLGYSDLGFLGSEIRTPNLDELAAAGTVLTDFHVAPACSPTRAMLLTGVDAHPAGLGTMAGEADELQAGRPGYEGVLSDRVVTVAQLLRDAGYATLMAGKWHLGAAEELGPDRRGFERSFALLPGGASHFADARRLDANDSPAPYREDGLAVELPADFYSTDFYTDMLIEYVGEAHDRQRPFFAYAAYTSPHWPLQATDEYIDRYRGDYDEGWDVQRARRMEGLVRAGVIDDDAAAAERLPFVPAWNSLTSEQQRIQARKMELLAAMVESLDANVGRLLDYLREIGEYDDTLILFFSDNGAEGNPVEAAEWSWKGGDNRYENMGRVGSYVTSGPGWAQASTAPFRLFKAFATEGGIRVPAIVMLPAALRGGGASGPGGGGAASGASGDGAVAGSRAPGAFARGAAGAATGAGGALTLTDVFASVMDVAPTLLEIAGVEPPGNTYAGRAVVPLEGTSMLPYLRGAAPVVHPTDYAMGWELFGRRALRQGDWKIVWNWEPYGPGRWQLYDLANDPAEQTDLAEARPDRLQALLGLWNDYVARNGVVLPGHDSSYAIEKPSR